MDGEYRKDFLIKDIISALQDAAKKVLRSQLKVNHVKLGNNVITFYFENNLISRFNLIKLVEELHNLWDDFTFQGKNGRYIFGDILSNTKIEYQHDMLISIELPFYKIEYHEYLEYLPRELNMLLLSRMDDKSDTESFGKVINLNLIRNSYIYKELFRIRYRGILSKLIKIINDSNINIGWEKFYYHLIKREIHNISISDFDGTLNRRYLLLLIKLHILIDYPNMYDKFAEKSGLDWDVLYQEILRINPGHPLYEYMISGKIPNGYILRSADIGAIGDYIILLIQMIKDGVKFESADLYYGVVTQQLIYLYSLYVVEPLTNVIFEFLDDITFQKNEINSLVDFFKRTITLKYPYFYPIVPILMEYRHS